MPSAKFAADFESFYAAVDKADAKLADFQAGAGRVETALNKMVDSFSGRKLIQEATLAVEAVERVGGASKLTSAELARVADLAERASEKLRAMGASVPESFDKIAKEANLSADAMERMASVGAPGLQRLGDAAGRAHGPTNALSNSFRAFDGVLATLGINLGPQAKGLEDIANASGKTAAQLGGVAVAGLAVGAGVAGWKIGRAAAEFFDLDEKIGNATAKLLGFGDVAGEKAAAAADQMARASKYAGFEVKELGLAQMLNAQAAQEAIKANTDYSDNLTRMKGPEESAKQIAKWRAELDTVRASGVLPGLTADLQSQNFSMADLAKRYVLSAEALQIYAKEVANIDKVHEKNEAGIQRLAGQWKAAEEKIAEEHARALESIAKYEANFDNQRIQQRGSATEREIADILKLERELIASLERRDEANAENLARVHADTKRALDGVGVEWDTVRSKSLSTLQDQAARALETYRYMTAHANEFTQGALQAQLEKYRQLAEAATAMGRNAADAQDRGREATERHNKELERQHRLQEAVADQNAKNAAVRSGGKAYTIGPDGNPVAVTQITNDFVGRVTPLSDREASDPAFLNSQIAKLTKMLAEWAPVPPDVFRGMESPFAGMPRFFAYQRLLLEDAQRLADAKKQLEYLRELQGLNSNSSAGPVAPLSRGGWGGSGSITVNINVSGVMDMRTQRELADVVTAEVMKVARINRMFPSA